MCELAQTIVCMENKTTIATNDKTCVVVSHNTSHFFASDSNIGSNFIVTCYMMDIPDTI